MPNSESSWTKPRSATTRIAVAFAALSVAMSVHGNPPIADTLDRTHRNDRFAIGAHFDGAVSENVHLLGLHVAQLSNRTADQIGWGFSAQFGFTPGLFEQDTANRASEIAPADATPSGRTRLRALGISGGLTLCLRAPLWMELGGGYYLPERASAYVTKNGNHRWFAAGDNSALPMATAALVVDFSGYRLPLHLRLGAARADNTTFYSIGLGWAAILPN
ncbi:MAG: hypothetical protein IPN71_07750 [Fibrobacteres bacterium]|jgi:hypothetical protein|nr:hypothetical protein [Fibrobacterota bacterium]